jgi:hypothetical protein
MLYFSIIFDIKRKFIGNKDNYLDYLLNILNFKKMYLKK